MDVADFHPLLEPIGNSPLPCRRGLGEGNGATEGAGGSAIAYTCDADIVDTGDGSIASHTSGHLDLHVELGAGGKRDALDTEAGHVLGHLSGLEGGLLGTTRGTVDISGEGAGAVLVDL